MRPKGGWTDLCTQCFRMQTNVVWKEGVNCTWERQLSRKTSPQSQVSYREDRGRGYDLLPLKYNHLLTPESVFQSCDDFSARSIHWCWPWEVVKCSGNSCVSGPCIENIDHMYVASRSGVDLCAQEGKFWSDLAALHLSLSAFHLTAPRWKPLKWNEKQFIFRPKNLQGFLERSSKRELNICST